VVNLFKDKILLVFALSGVTFVALAVIGGFRMYSHVPFWDMWDGYLGFYVKVSAGDWSAWWAQHNEHRIVLARMFFWLDLGLFQGQGWFLLVINYILIGMACLIFWQAWKEKTTDGTPWVGYFLIAWLFSWSQENNLTWGFQSQFILAQLLPLAAFYFIHRAAAAGMHQSRDFYFAILFGVLAIGSMANGVLVLPLMTGYALLARMGWKRGALLAVLSAACLWLYFHDFKAPANHGSLTQALRDDPLGLVHYVLLYVGGPFSYFFGKEGVGQAVATIAGIFMVGSSAAFAWRIMPVAHKATLSLALLVFILYVGGTALGTAGGRLIFGVDQALSSRYMTPALMAWAALLLLYLPKLKAVSQPVRGKIWMPFLLLVLLMLPQQLKALGSKQDVLFEREIAALALELGVKDQAQIGNVFPSADWAQSISEVPIARNLSIFGVFPIKDARETVGRTTNETSRLDPLCQGGVDEVQSVEGDARYLRVRGWFFDPNRDMAPKSARLLDGDGVVQGIILTGQPRPDVASAIGPAAGGSGFKGYVQAEAQGKTLVLRDPEGDCQLAETVPAILFNSAKVTNSSLVSVSVSQIQPQNEWTGGDFNRSSIPGLAVFGSFINSDSDHGSIVLKLNRGDRLLYRSGPTGGRQFIQVVNNPELTALLPLATEWVQLEFSSELLPEVFEIKFTDKGDGWGEWSAVALKIQVN